jgi:hypothetical protein
MSLLNPGDLFPRLSVPALDGDDLDVPGSLVAALSVDDEATTKALAAELELDFPLGHSADAHEIAGLTGAFVNPS